jgi:long-chain acyl-CoA synthetase
VLRLIEKWHGTFTVASITVFLALMDHPDITRRNLSSLTKVYSGGAPVSEGTVQHFERLTGAYIHNIYGLTETTSPSHAVPMGKRAPVDKTTGALSVGVPVPGFIVRVVDPAPGEDVAPGELGEFYTKGPGVVPGYWQRPDATRENFTDGYLHTGDVGTMDERGYFYIMDRSKDMINVSGYKVWPREVEDMLYTHPAVREAAVVGIPDPYRGEVPKAFVALKRDYEGKVTPDEFITYIRERMAAYKVPRAVEILPELPKTPTGKFLRRELRQRELEAAQAKGL